MKWAGLVSLAAISLFTRHISSSMARLYKQWLVFDIDRHDAYDLLQDPHVPPPNIICINPVNNHAHLYYLLETPVRTAPDGSAICATLLRCCGTGFAYQTWRAMSDTLGYWLKIRYIPTGIRCFGVKSRIPWANWPTGSRKRN